MKTILNKEQSGHLVDLGLHSNKWTLYRNEQGFNETYEYFTLTDLLEILPKEIKIDNSLFNLEIHVYNDIVHVIYCVGGMFPLAIKKSKELIDALYELACWYYGEFLKSEKK